MQAVILAGGLGTRLRPLTNSRPKPLIPILGRPMVEYIIDSLPREVDTIILAVSYMSEQLKEHFSSGDGPVDVVIINEEEPLGTGGAIKNVESYLDGTFLVFNGDVICTLDMGEMLSFHRRKRGIGTISLWQVDDPSRYGVVDIDDAMRVHRFLEKVPKEEAPSDLINAGTYVLEPDILDLMEPGIRTSIEREVFPKVVENGLYGFRFGGYWVDAGTRASLIEAQGHVLANRGNHISGTIAVDHVKLHAPVHISDGCGIGKGTVIGPNVFIGEGSVIGEGCELLDSVLFEGCRIGDRAKVSGSVLAPRTNVRESISVTERITEDDEDIAS